MFNGIEVEVVLNSPLFIRNVYVNAKKTTIHHPSDFDIFLPNG